MHMGISTRTPDFRRVQAVLNDGPKPTFNEALASADHGGLFGN
jgi:hypothetical protein